MAIERTSFDTPQAFSAVDFSPLAKLGQAGRQDATLAALAKLSPQQPPAGPAPGAPASAAAPVASPGGTAAAFSAPPTGGDVNAAIRATAAAAGVDVPSWKAMASIESSLNPSSNVDRPTQYKGLFQIGSRDTRESKSEWTRHGKGSIYDPMDNASAAANLAMENSSWFRKAYGRDPTPTEVYMMHQQGQDFYRKGTMTNVEGNPYPGMTGPQTPQSFEEGWGREIERRARYFRNSEEASANGD